MMEENKNPNIKIGFLKADGVAQIAIGSTNSYMQNLEIRYNLEDLDEEDIKALTEICMRIEGKRLLKRAMEIKENNYHER